MWTDTVAAGRTSIAHRGWLIWAGAFVAIAGVLSAGVLANGDFIKLLPLGAMCLALAAVALSSPVVAAIGLLCSMFLRVALTGVLPEDPFVVAFLLMAISFLLWTQRTAVALRALGKVEVTMVLLLLWNAYSMLAPHEYAAGDHLTNEPISVPRLIVTGTFLPFALYFVGRHAFDSETKVRALLWSVLAISAYSAATSIMQFTGPTNLVWPRYIITGGEENWVGRASGVLNQPVANGMILALGFAIAMVLISRREEHPLAKAVAGAVAVACGFGLYLTHTRAAWLSALVMVVLGALLAKGFRRGFLGALALAVTAAVVNWSLFTSNDREAGGIGSTGEVYDRLNSIRTAIWAVAEKPLAGWGLGRFQAVNTYHHKQWAADVPYERGYGIVAHSNELGIAAELGLIGLGLWLTILVLIVKQLLDWFRTAPQGSVCGRPLAMLAVIGMAIMVCSGLTVDLRLFDFAPAVVFLVAGVAIGWLDRGGSTMDRQPETSELRTVA